MLLRSVLMLAVIVLVACEPAAPASVAATSSSSFTALATASPTPTATVTPTATATETSAPTPTAEPTPQPTAPPAPTPAPPTPTVRVTAPPTQVPTPDPTATPQPTPPATPAPTATPVRTTATRPVIVGVHSSNDTYTYVHVTFSKPMLAIGEGGGVTMLGNYQLDQRALPTGTTIVCGSPTCDLIRIDLPTTFMIGSPHTIRIANVVDRNGLNISPDPAIVGFTVEAA